ncbi:DUF6745 domain-containing protein [Williamsia sp.]|uniref:DUF6745 domain-containing protein n=1 Tax=Williamsia sp. TaxID=1872085 RepID=UPI002F9254F3
MSAAFGSSIVGTNEFFEFDSDHHHTIAAVHAEWLAAALATGPSDRTAAEAAVAQLYRLACRPEPEFVWVPSPPAGAELIAAEGLADAVPLVYGPPHSAHGEVAAVITASKRRMARRIDPQRPRDRRHLRWTPLRTPREASPTGPRANVRLGVRDSLHTTVSDGIAAAIRTLMPPIAGYVTWYGQHEVPWIAHCDAIRRLGLARFSVVDIKILDIQSTLARATGWWWPFDAVCVMVERPVALHAEATPDARHGQRRLHHPNDRALEFADGQGIFALNGTIVPEWLMRDPTVERISRERNVEVRRCAIERIGWDTYIDEAGMKLVDQADDPGNHDGTLALYATPASLRPHGRILLVRNGSRERDGTRRRYGLPVPDGTTSALDAAGWTYGISGADYANLVRRT